LDGRISRASRLPGTSDRPYRPREDRSLSVTDIASTHRVAAIEAYVVPFDPSEEADVPDVFFAPVRLDEANCRLLIDSERRQHGDAVTTQP
jgi:hypothetical protein